MKIEPKYLKTSDADFLFKIKQAKEIFSGCSLCGHKCGVNRTANELGFCCLGEKAQVAHAQIHFGEEPPLSDYQGAGAIFFSGCNLECVYCQNFQISQQKTRGSLLSNDELARLMLKLQNDGAQNIDLVSPTHFAPNIIEAVYYARKIGLNVPIVYNTNAYDSARILEILSGVVDIYLPDFKYFNDERAFKYSGIRNYVSTAKTAVKIMHEQTGDFFADAAGRALRGVIIRHLVLPNQLADSKEVLRFLKQKLGVKVGLSIMNQYAPCYKAGKFAELNRKITALEYDEVTNYAEELGFLKCWIQEFSSSEIYFPDFDSQKVFQS